MAHCSSSRCELRHPRWNPFKQEAEAVICAPNVDRDPDASSAVIHGGKGNKAWPSIPMGGWGVPDEGKVRGGSVGSFSQEWSGCEVLCLPPLQDRCSHDGRSAGTAGLPDKDARLLGKARHIRGTSDLHHRLYAKCTLLNLLHPTYGTTLPQATPSTPYLMLLRRTLSPTSEFFLSCTDDLQQE